MYMYSVRVFSTCLYFNIYVWLLFHIFSVLVANPKKLLYTVANPARGAAEQGEKKKKRLAAFGEKKNVTRRSYMSRCYAGRR